MSSALALQQSEPVLGRYRPIRPLGSGGSGSVWLARDEKTGLDVALKIVAREGKAAARAEREASAAARLRHPSCLRAYAFARDARHVYIAYEFVPGRTFREALRAGELEDVDAVEACAQVSEGLAHAHRAGILHRDVKPSNVLLAEGERISARVLDFGLARMAEAETLTAQGDVPGTLAYISPERLAGEDATEAADVWAVGVMLWVSLAGRLPFWQTSMLDTARAIEAGAPSLATLRPDLPKQLIQLVDRALSLSPTRRPSAGALADALRGAAAYRRRKRARAFGISVPSEAGRAAAAGLAAAFVAWTAVSIPFYPHGWAAGLAVLAAAVTALRPRTGLAVALAVPVLPLGALGLVPLAAATLRAGPRRAAQAGLAVLVAALVAGMRHASLPLVGSRPPLGLGIAGARDPFDVAGSLGRAAAAQPGLIVEACVFAGIALALPFAHARGRWGAAAVGGAMLVATIVAVPSAPAASLAAAAWLTAAAVALRARRA